MLGTLSNLVSADWVKDAFLYVIGPGSGWIGSKWAKRRYWDPRAKKFNEFIDDAKVTMSDVTMIKDDLKVLKVMTATQQAHTQLIMKVAIRDPVWFADEEGKNTGINQRFTQLLGWTSEEMRNYGWKRIIPERFREAYYAHWELCVKEERDFEFNAGVLHRDGTEFEAVFFASRKTVPFNGSQFTAWLGMTIIGDSVKRTA